MATDVELLRQFAADRGDPAFRALVVQRIDFVYGAALRQVHGDAHLAAEVTQSVFLDLARKARVLAARPTIAGWLYTSTRFAAAKALRSRIRRLNRETEAHAMQQILSASSAEPPAWHELRPLIDAAMHELNERDREAVLLRFFEGRPLAEIGTLLGLTENAARMRVDRALDKLRERLARRGITSTVAALGAALAAQPVATAPAGLAAAVAATSMAGAAGGTLAAGLTVKLAAAAVALLAGAGAALIVDRAGSASRVIAAERRQGELGRGAEANRRVSEENRQLLAAAETAEATARNRDSTVDPLARLRATVALIQDGSLGDVLWVSGFNWGPVVNPAVARLFELTDADRLALEAAVDATRNEIVAGALAGAKVHRDGNELTIEITPPVSADAAWERLKQTFRRTLGPDRYPLFEQSGWAGAVEQLFSHIGRLPVVWTITHDDPPRRPNAPYMYSQARVQPGLPRRGGGGGGGSRSSLATNLGPYDALVPPGF